jgi:hypothetical protein
VSIFLQKERTLHGNTPALVGFSCIFIAAKNVSNKSCLFQIGGRDVDETVRTVIHNLPVVAPVPSPIRSMLPSDFNLYGPLKKHLAGMRFATDADVKQAVTAWLSTFNSYFFLRRDTGLGATMGQTLKCGW